MDKYQILKHYFGHDAFRTGQETLIDALVSGRDALGIMPTGAGKSMCYQVPALMLPGITIVISPLISLMKDQVAALKMSGVPAAYLNSSLTPGQMELAMSRAMQNAYKIIYVAPERLDTASFQRFARQTKISLVAVDEAHCVSQWGQDFRPNYLHIADFIDQLPVRPVVGAFTATATSRVKSDIMRLLGLRDPCISTTGFDRPNLFFEVCQPKSKYEALRVILRQKSGASGIVYCSTRKTVEQVTAKLIDEGINAGRYHAGLSDEERKQNQEDFQYDRVSVMVATNAFGMGIDKSNVSFVIHYNMPRSMEAYYQEAGRAGRDGSEAECILLYSGQDIMTGKWMIEHSDPNPELTTQEQAKVKAQDLRRLNQMADYCTKATCLRAGILRYFGQTAGDSCGACSRCVSGHYTQVNGIERQKITAEQKRAAKALPMAGESLVKLGPAKGDSLFEALRAVRLELSRINHCPPFVVAGDKTLTDMAMKKPVTKTQLLQIYGIGDTKAEKFGDAFLKAIRDWKANSASPEDRVSSPDNAPAVKHSLRPKSGKAADAWSSTQTERLRRGYLAGVTIMQLAAIHGREQQQIWQQLRKMKLVFDASAIEHYGVAAYEPDEDDDA